jgi:hypothetical protein
MDIHEQVVMWNLLARYPSKLFICPQFQKLSDMSTDYLDEAIFV